MKELTPDEIERVRSAFDKYLYNNSRFKKEASRELLLKAFRMAFDAHAGMRRKNGEPYIIHPIEVARIVVEEIGLGTTSAVAALLHDVIEDSDYTIEQIESAFGHKIAFIVRGLTKIKGAIENNRHIDSHIQTNDDTEKQPSDQAETFRKILMTISDDIRVILVKFADRLHNMRTLSSMPLNKQLKIAGETLYIYAPLAHRMGLYKIKTELEDLCLKYRHPEIYNEIEQKLSISERKRNHFINRFSAPIINELTDMGVKFDISGRPKSIFSIWKKMQAKQVPFEEVFDLFAIRIVFRPRSMEVEKAQCFEIYQAVAKIYPPTLDRLRDWVTTPKSNGYEALHVTVMGPDGKIVEVQIRSERMNEIAEVGLAAHWKYKGIEQAKIDFDKSIKDLLKQIENSSDDAVDLLDDFKLNLSVAEILVFTPKGKIVALPANATVLDFAFEIHSAIGAKAVAAKVNQRLVALNHQLNTGDQVEIITSEKNTLKSDWVSYATTAKARTAIREMLRKERREILAIGKNIISNVLVSKHFPSEEEALEKLMEHYGVGKESLYYQVGEGKISEKEMMEVLLKRRPNKFIKFWQVQLSRILSSDEKDINTIDKLDKKNTFVISDELDDNQIKISQCCLPIPGDNLLAYQHPDGTISIHKTSCPKALKLQATYGESVVKANWVNQKRMGYLTGIKMEGIDRVGIVNQITNIISTEMKVSMSSICFKTVTGIFEGTIELYVYELEDLNNLIAKIRKIDGIRSVSRIENIQY